MSSLNVLVLVNSESPQYGQAYQRILPYLDHFGVPYDLVDMRVESLPARLDDYPLILFAHPGMDRLRIRLSALNLQEVRDAVCSGCGMVSFDADLSGFLTGKPTQPLKNKEGDQLDILGGGHYITHNHPAVHSFKLSRPVFLKASPKGEILARIGNMPLLTAGKLENGRWIHWSSTEWMHTSLLGPLSGLDDLFWRSLVWAARKPFCMRGLPPFVTMRVDDVAGRGKLWNASPLYWVEEANQAGFKPWLGLFIYNLSPETIQELRVYLNQGRATAFPHAFGRPPRLTESENQESDFYYYPNAIPLRSDRYDEFIYFDHQNSVPWSDQEARHGLAAVDQWYQTQSAIPISSYAIAHWGEMGTNTLAHIQDQWGCDLIATYHGPDRPLTGANWLVGGPFRKYETPGSALFDPSDRGSRPVYYADFQNFAGRRFFLSFTEIRDETGYEWAPDNDIQATAERGIRQIRRALDSMALPTLFTHETDYIHKIKPENWTEILKRISLGIAAYEPIQVTLEAGIAYVRDCRTSSLHKATYHADSKEILLEFLGESQQKTFTCLFHEEAGRIEARWIIIPEFRGKQEVRVKHEQVS